MIDWHVLYSFSNPNRVNTPTFPMHDDITSYNTTNQTHPTHLPPSLGRNIVCVLCVLHIKPFFLLVDIQHTQCPQCDPPTHPTTYLTHPPIREPTIHNSYTHHQPMHEPPCVYNNRTAVQNRAAETHPLTTHKPTMTLNCAYNSTAVQPYSRKKKKKKEAESGV